MRNPPLLLVVEDDTDFLEVLTTKLSASGFTVSVARDGEEGVAQAKMILPDLILMDVKMPKLDGVGALTKLRADPLTAHLKVVLMTAYGDPQPDVYQNDQKFATDLGAVGYILKAQDLSEIVEKIKSFLA